MSERWRSRLKVLALVLLVMLTVSAVVRLFWYDWITDVVVVRAAYALWLIGLVIRSRPQELYWSLPIAVGLGAMILVLARHLGIRRSARPPSPAEGRVAEWAEWLELAAVSPYFVKYVRRRVARLAERVLQLESHPHIDRADESAPVAMPTLPTELRALLYERHRPSPGAPYGPVARALEEIVDYLESVLEVDHDR